jgi:DNA primase catalytic core
VDQITFDQLVADVKARTDLVAVVRRHVELRESGNHYVGRSLKNPDTTPSLVVWPDSQKWRDYSGGGSGGGDVLAFVQYARDVPFMLALRELATDAGIAVPDTSNADLERLHERRRLEELLTAAVGFYHRHLDAERRSAIKEERGYTDATIDRVQLGFGAPGLWEHLGELGATEEERLSTGLFVQFRSGARADFFANRLIFPYWRGGRVVYLIGRRTEASSDAEWDRPKYKKLPVRSEKHPYISPLITNDFFFGEDDANTDGVLLITEGIADAIAAQQAGFKCLSPVTTTFRAQDHEKLVRLTAKGKRVVVVNDSEDSGAGERGARETAKVLHAAGRDVRIATIPRPDGVAKVDVNDVVRAHGAEGLRAVVDAARSLPMFLVERIPEGIDRRELVDALRPVVEAMRQQSPIEQSELKAVIGARFSLAKRELNQQLVALERDVRRDRAREHADKPVGDKPGIVVNDRQRSELIEESSGVLTAANAARIDEAKGAVPVGLPLLFVRGGRVVGLLRDKEGEAPKLNDLNATEMYGLLVRYADWLRKRTTDEGVTYDATTPPVDVPQDLLAFPPKTLSSLESVVSTPVFARNGSLLSAPGHHVSESLWLHLDPSLGELHVPESPTAADVAVARGLLIEHLLFDFPFVDPSDRTHMIAALLLPFARRLVTGCTPLHVIKAPTPGSGKGLLANLLGIIATGTVCNGCTLPGEEEEVRKKLSAELATGRPIVLLDNLPEKRITDSATLASVLTAETWTDRLLGATRMLTLPNRAVWLCSANNPRFSLELVRRSVRIRIDPKQDMPWHRSGFRHDPILDWARDNRSKLVRALLTLIRAWVAAGRPAGKRSLGSFESWARVMGGILEVAGIDAFLANSTDFYAEADEEGEAWRAFTRAWWEKFGPTPVRVLELNELCDLHELLVRERGDGPARSQQTKLGSLLRAKRDRVFGELRIGLAHDGGHKGKLYALSIMRADSPAPSSTEAEAGDSFVDPWADDAPAVASGNLEAETGTFGERSTGQVPSEKGSVSP